MSEQGQTRQIAARCICGAVAFTASTTAQSLHACHCSTCRRWSGGVYMGIEVSDIRFEPQGNEKLGVFRSSEWAERLFCRECGACLIWRMSDGSYQVVSIAALDPQEDLPLGSELFVDERPSGYAFAGNVQQLTGAQILALMSGENTEAGQ
ncbi:MAG: GFA family protein [Pseudomonadota bacterium]